MGLFGTKSPVEPDEWEWMLASFKWLLEEYGGAEMHRRQALILPTEDFFAVPSDREEIARALFEQTKLHAGMRDWPATLAAGERGRERSVQPGFALVHQNDANLGEFRLRTTGDRQVEADIRYNPDLVDAPEALIATLAHELAHYLLCSARTRAPGGEALHEHLTDLCAVFLGFGIFLANNARSFAAFSEFDQMGWQSSLQGYLSEKALVTALVVSESLAGRDASASAAHLKPHLRSDLKRAQKFVSRRDLKAEMEAIDLGEFGVSAFYSD
ncbi:MAG: hypothetical protein ABR601_07850 [Parasphingopyxis sp.]